MSDKNLITAHREQIISDNSDFLDNKLFLEFGVMEGESTIEYIQTFLAHNLSVHTYGFDSWHGLPEETNDPNNSRIWSEGKFSMHGKKPAHLLNRDDITLVDGYFSDSLQRPEVIEQLQNKPAGIIHLDCDIYTSTKEALEFCIKYDILVPRTIIVYDDWAGYLHNGLLDEYASGQGMCHKEIESEYNLEFEHIDRVVVNSSNRDGHIINVFRYIGQK
tara:strand:+ start:205 stop:858 length:654 start_codon:yes stop_codon:yes gene_type:complete